MKSYIRGALAVLTLAGLAPFGLPSVAVFLGFLWLWSVTPALVAFFDGEEL